jgi:hypothetical protein
MTFAIGAVNGGNQFDTFVQSILNLLLDDALFFRENPKKGESRGLPPSRRPPPWCSPDLMAKHWLAQPALYEPKLTAMPTSSQPWRLRAEW